MPGKGIYAFIASLFGMEAKAETVPISITPSPPPGISGAIQTLLSWLMWLGWIAVAGGFIAGAIHFVLGNTESGKKLLIGAIIGAIMMAFYSALIAGLIS
ncbi:MAG: hypothetical protein ACP5I2_07370 [Fervidicoccaceae archaeon]|jgi:hypothetical protein|nr:MAG: hypothetical protein C0179_08500 [Fervidicoccus sp.]